MASQGYNPYQQQQIKQQRPWIRDNHSLVAVNPEKIVTLLELATGHYGKKCARCASKKALTVHHRHYRHTGFEKPIEDIVLLCNTCHQDLHKRGKEKRLNRDDIQFVDPQWAEWLQGIEPPVGPDLSRERLALFDHSLRRAWRTVFRDHDEQEWVMVDFFVTQEGAAQSSLDLAMELDLAMVMSVELMTDGLVVLEPHQRNLMEHPRMDSDE